MHLLGHIVRFIVSALILMVVDWVVPGFTVGGFWSALFLALVIAIAAWIIEGVFGRKITPFGRGIVGFLVSALVIWLSQFIVSGVSSSFIGAILHLPSSSGSSTCSSRSRLRSNTESPAVRTISNHGGIYGRPRRSVMRSDSRC